MLISDLCQYRFALDNGTIGVYNKKQRLWRVKTKFKVISLVPVEADIENNIYCLVVGWSNGKVEVRSDTSGEVLFKITTSTLLANILKGDLRNDGTNQIICVTTDGHGMMNNFN